MSASRLIELARARGLNRVADLLSRPDSAAFVDRVADADDGLSAEPQADPILRLGLICRRGLAPSLVLGWIESLESTLERGLAAWDVLTGSLIDDDEWLVMMRTLAEPMRALLPAPGQRGVSTAGRSPVDVLRDQLGAPSPANMPADDVARLGLPGLWALYQAGGDARRALTSPEVRSGIRAQGRLLGLAHLPTLASLWLLFASRALEDDEGYAELVEILLDEHAIDQLRSVSTQLGDTRLAKYVMARAAIDGGDPGAAYALIKTLDVLTLAPSLQRREEARIQLVRADLGLRTGEQPIPALRIEQIVQEAPTWRYAARVRACMAAAMCAPDSSSPIRMLDEYLSQFGNDDAFWLGLVENGPSGAAWFAHMMARLTRELLALPHDPWAWIAMATIVGGDEAPAAVAEIRDRLVAQSRF